MTWWDNLTPGQGSLIGGLGGAGIGAATAVGRGFGARKRQRRQQKYTERNMALGVQNARTLRQTQFQDMTRSMREAGLNPLMMYAGGSAGGQASAAAPMGAGPADAPGGEIAQAATAGAAAAAETKRLKLLKDQTAAEIIKKQSESKLNAAKTVGELFKAGPWISKVGANVEAMKGFWKQNPYLKELIDKINSKPGSDIDPEKMKDLKIF